jgi:branched-chain amino acid transport system permease protein
LPTKVFYIALAGVYVLAAYLTKQLMAWGLPWPLAVLGALAAGVGVSLLCDLLNHRPLEKRRSSMGAHMISSLGIYMILVQVVALVWGNDPQVLKTGIGGVWRVGDVVMAHSQLAALSVSFVLVAVFFAWLKKSDLGLRFRGLSDNPVEMELLGYDTDRLRTLAFAISGFLGSAAGILNAYDLGFDPNIGMSAVMLAIVATIIGGRGTFIGPVIGGLLLGVVRSQVVWHASARWQDAITFLLLAIFLLCRPNGIIGGEKRLEANE